jgi:hypothetical protein
MLHKNAVQDRIRKAKESLGRPVGENRYEVEPALRPVAGSARPCCSPPPPVMITIPGAGALTEKPGQASARIRYAAGRASRSVSS